MQIGTRAGGVVLCEEVCTYTFQVRPAGYLILWDSTFESNRSGLYFGDQEEMGLGVRVATPLMVKPYENRQRERLHPRRPRAAQ